MTRISEGLSPE